MALTTLGSKPEGSIIKIPERGKGEVDFYVAKHNYESKLNGVGYTLVVRKDCYADGSWNSTNINTYANCNAGNIVDGSYKRLIVDEVQPLINTTKFYYTPGNGNNTVTTLQRKIFLLSATELGYSYIRANVEGTALPIAGTLKIANFNGSTIGQWTRSPSLGDTRDAIVAPAHGEYCIESRCTESEGLRPAFTLPASLFISDDGSITPNTAPSVPSSITIPNSINGGTTITVSWAKSTDSEDNLEGYIVERSADGGSNWKKIYQGNGTSTTNSIPFGTASVIYRVKDYDDAGLQSGWRTSSQVNVHNNTAPTVPENINVPNSITWLSLLNIFTFLHKKGIIQRRKARKRGKTNMGKRRMTLPEFIKQYGTEKQCQEHLFALRWPNGFVCPKCGGRHAYTLSNGKYQCRHCRYQASVTAGTIMHRTHAPLTKWFLAMYLVTNDKRGISALQLKTQIGVTYKTAWYMLTRIRKAMENRDDSHQLEGVIEFDDAFFGGPTVGKKRGRGTEKAKVFVALSLDANGNPLYLKMKTTENIRQKSVRTFAEKHIAKGSTIRSDDYCSYAPALTDYNHEPVKYDPQGKMLHWLHIMVSNAKAFILGTYHGLPKANLSCYLAEFCFRFSRRNFGDALFDRLALALMITLA